MQRGIGNRDTAHKDRLQTRNRRDHTRAADLKLDALHTRHFFLRGEFMSNGKARRTGHIAKNTLRSQGVDLVDHTVNFKGQTGTTLLGFTIEIQQTLHALHDFTVAAQRHAQAFQPVHHARLGITRQRIARRLGKQGILRLICGRHRTDLTPTIGKKTQRPFGCNPGVQLTQTTCGRITRIHKYFLATLGLVLVQALKVRPVHQNLASHFQHGGQLCRIATQAQRNGFDGADIAGDVLARGAITTRRCLYQQTLLITQADRQAVKLVFSQIIDPAIQAHYPGFDQSIGDTLVESLHFLVIKGIAQGQHGNSVLNRVKAVQRRCTHALRG